MLLRAYNSIAGMPLFHLQTQSNNKQNMFNGGRLFSDGKNGPKYSKHNSKTQD